MSRTKLGAEEEEAFLGWYRDIAEEMGLNRDPDDPLHKYDYRGAYREGLGPDADGHWPSAFKDDDHPNRFVDDDGNVIDSKSGKTTLGKFTEAKQDNVRVIKGRSR